MRSLLFALTLLSTVLYSCSEPQPSTLHVSLTYANGNPADAVDVHLFKTEEGFTELRTEEATTMTSDAEGKVEFSDLDLPNYWLWAKIGTRSGGGKVPVSEGDNTLDIVLK